MTDVSTPLPGKPLFSIVIPACDEERLLPRCLDAIAAAAARLGEPIEVIVVDNMSRDRTAVIARQWGARVVQEEAKCLSKIRNRGAREATGTYLVFCDADTFMSSTMLAVLKRIMDSGRYVGGGVGHVRPDRLSLGMVCSCLIFLLFALYYIRTTCTLFYTTPDHFRAIGGFDESLYAVEDVDFGIRLMTWGRQHGLRYKNLFRGAHVVTSARKFDEFGDWFIVRHPMIVWRAFRNDRAVAHEIWYRDRR